MKSPLPDPGLFPRRLTLELSSICNLHCVMCPRRYLQNQQGLMTRELFDKILAEIASYPIEAVVPFFRGEPLLHPDFPEMLALLRKKTKAQIQLATNALLLDRPMAEKLLEIGINFISFSLDAYSRQTYQKIRCGGNFDLALNHIHQFLKLRRENRSAATLVQVSATENRYNRAELPLFIAYWKSRVERVRIYAEHSADGRYGRLSREEFCRPEISREPCRKPFHEMVVYYDGATALCNHDWSRKTPDCLGSVMDHSLAEIWQDRPYQNIRERHRRNQWCDLRPCGDCDHWQGADPQASRIGLLIQ